jgi:nucleoside phosphorylase
VTSDGQRIVSASADRTLKVWDLGTGALVATLAGHGSSVSACAVTPDGRRVVSTSYDRTLKVWDLVSGACLLTHHSNAVCTAFVATTTAIVVGDDAGAVWFLDWPSPNHQRPIRDGRPIHDHDPLHGPSPEREPAPQSTPMKHTILFLAANPLGTDRLALDREARAIHDEIERSGFRDSFALETRWAAEPLDLLRELRKLKPTVVHFSGHGASDVAGARRAASGPHRDVVVEDSPADPAQHGLYFQGPDGRPQLVSAEALAQVFEAAGSSVKLVILSACYTDQQAAALVAHVDCVIGMRGSIRDDAARGFAIGFYGGLGERESVGAAYKQGCAAIGLEGTPRADRPQLKIRHGVDAAKLILVSAPPANRLGASAAPAPGPARPGGTPGLAPKVDVGILTIREDEFRAVLDVFPMTAGIIEGKGKMRKYALRHADIGGDQHYTIAVLRLTEKGLGEAQDAARDLIDDLAPRLVLVVGIAGGLPSDDVKLGDVVLSTRIQDFSVEERKYGKETTYAVAGGPVIKSLAADVAILAARDELRDWATALGPQPRVTWSRAEQLYGPPDWRSELKAKLKQHYPNGSAPRAPDFRAGPIASSDRLVKDPKLVIPWLATSRDLLAVEMESGGVYRAAQDRCPMLAIRGISDIVGLKRSDAWTKYACASAAAFTRAFLRTRPAGDPS